MKHVKRLLSLLLTILMLASLLACAAQLVPIPNEPEYVDLPVYSEDETQSETPCPVSEDGEYWTKDEVALYIHLYGHLPKNYITKSKAQSLGWEGGSLEPYAPGCSIGGGRFGNYEGFCRRRRVGPTRNAISTRAARKAAAQSASCSVTTD